MRASSWHRRVILVRHWSDILRSSSARFLTVADNIASCWLVWTLPYCSATLKSEPIAKNNNIIFTNILYWRQQKQVNKLPWSNILTGINFIKQGRSTTKWRKWKMEYQWVTLLRSSYNYSCISIRQQTLIGEYTQSLTFIVWPTIGEHASFSIAKFWWQAKIRLF